MTKRKNNETLQMYQIHLLKAFITLNALMQSDDLKDVPPLTLLFFGSTLTACNNTTYEANTAVALYSLKGTDITIEKISAVCNLEISTFL